MFSLTEAAADQIQQEVRRSGVAELALRVAARLESDGSLAFGMGFDEPREGDMPLQMLGVDILIAPPSQTLLNDTVLDFVEIEPDQYGFVFTERLPEAVAPGGCSGRKGSCSSCGGSSC